MRIKANSRKYGNKYILVSPEDYEVVKQYTWTIEKSGKRFYACTKINGKKVRLHRMLLNPRKGYDVDHINKNGLDNRRENLRCATKQQNAMNKDRANLRKRYKGVSFNKSKGMWEARISINKKRVYLGQFKLAREAAAAYNKAAKKYYKKFAVLNKI